ncbi:MAG: NAD-dependent DNA ligase LigA [Spirochaetales bacterium]|nr:NAD-dependent DNA ligase LigA [Spirochaetales bacterium]
MVKAEAQKYINEITQKLRQYQKAYYIHSRPSVSDREYDRLFDRLVELEKQFPDLIEPDSPTHRVGSDLSQEFPEFTHTIPVLSLDKAYTIREVTEWIEKCNATAGGNLSFVCEEKIDGASIVLHYEAGILTRALTRGNGLVGNDVTPNVRTIPSVPLKLSRQVDVVVRGEIFLPKAFFRKINMELEIPYANPRNLASGTLRRIRSAEVAKIPLDIFIYEGYFSRSRPSHTLIIEELEELGFKVNKQFGVFGSTIRIQELAGRHPEWTVGSIEALPQFLKTEAEHRESREYEIDGVVIKIDEIPIRENLGYTGHHPRWALAFKFEAPQGVTVIKAIDVQVGRTGRITPVARIKPVTVAGSTISNVTLHNQEYIDMLELALEDTVAVSKRGDVIPAIENVIEKNEKGNSTWKIPGTCPGCDAVLEKKGAHHFCVNPQCRERRLAQIKFFAGREQMDIENLGAETIDFLYSKKIINNAEDIYTFDPYELLSFNGFAEKKIELIKQGIEKSKQQPFAKVLQALGIPEIGKKVIELLIDAGFSDIDSIIQAAKKGDPEVFLHIRGIGEKVAQTLIKEFSRADLVARIARLKQSGLQFAAEKETSSVGQIFKDQTWCVTGSFNNFKPREKAKAEIKKRGGRITENVSANTTHLLVGSSPGSKYEKALALKAAIITEDEFIKLLKDG